MIQVNNFLTEDYDSYNATSKSILTRMLKKTKCCKKVVIEITKLLLQHGCDPNQEQTGVDSPLIQAVKMDCPELIKVLLDAKADVNHRGTKHHTALHSYFNRLSRRYCHSTGLLYCHETSNSLNYNI